jgi:hypothetical protein
MRVCGLRWLLRRELFRQAEQTKEQRGEAGDEKGNLLHGDSPSLEWR